MESIYVSSVNLIDDDRELIIKMHQILYQIQRFQKNY